MRCDKVLTAKIFSQIDPQQLVALGINYNRILRCRPFNTQRLEVTIGHKECKGFTPCPQQMKVVPCTGLWRLGDGFRDRRIEYRIH
jgi:hypothetical protein